MIFVAPILIACISQTPTLAETEFQLAVTTGKKVVQLQHSLPLINQVVLVPDEATYLDELSKWSPKARWPVLFDDNRLAPMFIRRFRPEKIWRRTSIGTPVKDFKLMAERVIAKAWGGTASAAVALKNQGIDPMGLVITKLTDPARISSVALAAGRGQPLRFIKDWGAPNEVWSDAQTLHHMSKAEALVREAGDSIKTITLCMSMPPIANYKHAKENPVATTDLIGRDKNGTRFAWCGWVFGSQKHSAYIAACSLFLPRTNYWFCNTYPNTGAWEHYGAGNMEEVMPQLGLSFQLTEGSIESLNQLVVGGISTDVTVFTSKGNQDYLELSNARIAPTWLPILKTPSVVNFIHSWSLKKPIDRFTVGGTWLDRGAYAYVGSSREPMLQAFVPPMESIRRMANFVPFLIASRWFADQGAYSKPWRINTIGDPLMICGPSQATNRKKFAALERSDCTSVGDEAKLYLIQTTQTPTDASFAKAVETVSLMGNDALVLQLWVTAIERNVAGNLTAKASLPSLFRKKVVGDFLTAFQVLNKPNRFDIDMLWHLSLVLPDSATSLLIDNIRGVYACDDIRAIAKKITKTRGNTGVLTIIDKYLTKARGRNERELKRMRKQYGG